MTRFEEKMFEEMVTDWSVDIAWLDFRVRVADHLAAMDEGTCLRLGLSDGVGNLADDVVIRAYGVRGFTVTWDWADGADRPGARHRRGSRVRRNGIDAYVLRMTEVLIAAGALHPVFVEVVEGDLVVIDLPAPVVVTAREAELPESVVPTSHEDLAEWVDRVLTRRLGRVPKKADDGSVGLYRDEDARLRVRVSSSRPVIEVSATVARQVDVRKARKLLPKLNASFHFFSFALVGDRLTVSTTVNARPFCPEHLDRAIETTFDYLDEPAGELRVKLARKTPEVESNDKGMEPDLLLLYGAHDDRPAMIEMARSLTGDSRSRLGRWRDVALEAGKVARRKAAGLEHGHVQNALIEQYIAWRSVAAAITEAVEDIVVEQETTR